MPDIDILRQDIDILRPYQYQYKTTFLLIDLTTAQPTEKLYYERHTSQVEESQLTP